MGPKLTGPFSMKKLLTLMVLSFFIVACQGPTPTEETLEDIPSTDFAPAIDELLTGTADTSRDDVTLLSSSELIDETSYGFSYGAESAIDQDLSTAWCREANDLTQRWGIDFGETVLAGTVGIQTGFARSEDIFAQNNRVKTAELHFDGELVETLEFEDTYDMQFVDLPDWPVKEISLYITDVYPGSKYDDTCLSEVDFWSDYVQEKDADAAQIYYIDEKADEAIRPISINNLMIVPTDSLTYCGSFNSKLYTKDGDMYQSTEENEWGYNTVFGQNTNEYSTTDWWLEGGLGAAFTAKMSSDVTEKDVFTIRWTQGKLADMETGEREWSVYNESTAYPQSCDDGTLYLSMEQPSNDLPGPFANFEVEVIYEDDVIGSTSFNFVQ